MTTQTLSDEAVATAVDAVFDEIDCISIHKAELPCGGSVKALIIQHDCRSGFLCEHHYRHWLDAVRPAQRQWLSERGYITCKHCLQRFETVPWFNKVYPVDK